VALVCESVYHVLSQEEKLKTPKKNGKSKYSSKNKT